MNPPSDARLERLEERREKNAGTQIINERLPAGASMYYYCESCGVQTAVKPEGWFLDPPPKHCEDCKDLIHDGVIDRTNTFREWCNEHGKTPYKDM